MDLFHQVAADYGLCSCVAHLQGEQTKQFQIEKKLTFTNDVCHSSVSHALRSIVHALRSIRRCPESIEVCRMEMWSCSICMTNERKAPKREGCSRGIFFVALL
ncbi:hypothetical protein L596_004768 [Steinernema carpocapsae]|uniref:Uncharacterized protein n=1 Tax=Steinernema carpocapsae TaxID=34508 RepID=A0A4U8UYB7_STECR|nr:hypothetical protein L596_004768 [Steinernema carpocapsae]